jgi:hypothetical protein
MDQNGPRSGVHQPLRALELELTLSGIDDRADLLPGAIVTKELPSDHVHQYELVLSLMPDSGKGPPGSWIQSNPVAALVTARKVALCGARTDEQKGGECSATLP